MLEVEPEWCTFKTQTNTDPIKRNKQRTNTRAQFHHSKILHMHLSAPRLIMSQTSCAPWLHYSRMITHKQRDSKTCFTKISFIYWLLHSLLGFEPWLCTLCTASILCSSAFRSLRDGSVRYINPQFTFITLRVNTIQVYDSPDLKIKTK